MRRAERMMHKKEIEKIAEAQGVLKSTVNKEWCLVISLMEYVPLLSCERHSFSKEARVFENAISQIIVFLKIWILPLSIPNLN
jgi:hypothetical protein